MGLRLCFQVWHGHAIALESECVTRVGIGKDGPDLTHSLQGQAVSRDRTFYAFVTDVVGNNAALSSAINGPDNRSLLFFWT